MSTWHALRAVSQLRKFHKARRQADTIEADLKALRLRAPEAVEIARRIAQHHAEQAAAHATRARL